MSIDRLGLGLAALGRPAYITSGREDDLGEHRSVDEMRARTAQVLDAAFTAGVRYIDCARSYGYAEDFLADWLRDRTDSTGLVVASKWGYRYVGDWRQDADVHEVKDHSAAAFAEQLALSRERLGDALAIYQVHSLMPDDPLLDDGAALTALASLRADGVRVGFSTSGPDQAATIRRALDVTVAGSSLFSVVQSTWNVLETSAGDALAEAVEAGLDVVVKEGMANGRLAPGSADRSPAAVAVRDLADDLDVGADAVALAAALAQPWAMRVLSGVVSVEQLASNLRAAELVLDGDRLAALTAMPEQPHEYWSARSERPWA